MFAEKIKETENQM